MSQQAIYTIAQIRAIEQQLFNDGLNDTELMERAGAAALKFLQTRWPNARRLAIVCGHGNNAGDGYVMARLAQQQDYQVMVYQVDPDAKLKATVVIAEQKCRQAGVSIQAFKSAEISHMDVIVDAILGIGFEGKLTPIISAAIKKINQAQVPCLALDVPSGLSANNGVCPEVAVKADCTLTFFGLKIGLLTGAGPQYCGEVKVADLDVPTNYYAALTPQARCLDFLTQQQLLQPRLRNAHKGDFGHVLVVGGDVGMAGAVAMAAAAAARVGAGVITVATHPAHLVSVNALLPEALCFGINKVAQLHKILPKISVIILGPGLGVSAWSQKLFKCLITNKLPMVVDADGLNLLANTKYHHSNWILTPHPGEAARLLNTTTAKVQADRLMSVTHLQQKWGGVVLLKGSGTLIKAPQQLATVCNAGNPGMASAGMGDVLSGVIAGLLAQGLSLQQAAECGVMLHTRAGDLAAQAYGERGLLATDLLPCLRQLVNPSWKASHPHATEPLP